MAPDANIVLLTNPVDETQGVQGLPEFLKLEQYALDHHLGQIISQSWGTAENTLFSRAGRRVLSDFECFYERAVGNTSLSWQDQATWGAPMLTLTIRFILFLRSYFQHHLP